MRDPNCSLCSIGAQSIIDGVLSIIRHIQSFYQVLNRLPPIEFIKYSTAKIPSL
jgi:hypothetical protein